jgi:hypothetical protein
MRFEKAHVVVFLSLLISLPLTAQQSSSPSISAATLLQQSLAKQVSNASISDITLAGTARRIAGSDDESGTAVLKAVAGGASRLDLTFPSGPRSELFNLTGATTKGAPLGMWSGADGISHVTAFHNLLSEPVWFFPVFAIARRLSSAGFVATYIGHETRNGLGVEHLYVSQTSSSQSTLAGPSLQHLTQVDFFLDSTTFLPVTLAFNTHPDNNELVDIPIEIDFSDYRSVGGIQIPFHIQKSLSGSLVFDFQAQTAIPNSGLSAAAFGAL